MIFMEKKYIYPQNFKIIGTIDGGHPEIYSISQLGESPYPSIEDWKKAFDQMLKISKQVGGRNIKIEMMYFKIPK